MSSKNGVKELLLYTEHDFTNYRILLDKTPESTIYHTKEFVDFVASHIGAEPFYIAIEENDRIIGAIPLVLKRNTRLGNIINSNPFFGSYGGLLVHPDLSPVKKLKAKRRLLELFDEFAKNNNCILSTVIASPFDRDQTFYLRNFSYNYIDRRIAQVTLLPSQSKKNLHDSLFYERFSSSCRRAVRSAEKKGVVVKETTEKGKALDEFYAIYKENMESKGGLVKNKSFFEDALDTFPKGMCNLKYAEIKDKVVAGIFQFYHKDIAEYYQPAIDHEHRNSGATNLLVFLGMEQAAMNGYLYWNFGGTWETMEDVYNFKRSFGAVDFVYYYYIKAYGDHEHIKRLRPEDLAKEYLGFYIIPFSELKHG